MMEQGAALGRAVHGDVEQGVLKSADIDLLGQADRAADGHRWRASKDVLQIVGLGRLQLRTGDRHIGHGPNDHKLIDLARALGRRLGQSAGRPGEQDGRSRGGADESVFKHVIPQGSSGASKQPHVGWSRIMRTTRIISRISRSSQLPYSQGAGVSRASISS